MAKKPPSLSDNDCEEEIENGKPRVKKKIGEFNPQASQILVERIDTNMLTLGGQLAWCVGDRDFYFVSSREATYALIVENWTSLTCRIIQIHSSNGRKNTLTSEIIVPSGSFIPDAIETLELNIGNCNAMAPLRPSSGWRRKIPPSPGQLKMLARIAMVYGAEPAIFTQVYSWSIGRACNVISRFKLMKDFVMRPIKSWKELVAGVPR